MYTLKEFLKFVTKLLLVVIFCLATGSVYGSDAVATVTAFSGDVKIIGINKKAPVSVDKAYFPIYQEDKIKTGKDSFCEIVFDNGNMLRIEQKTQISVQGISQPSIYLSIGKLLANIDLKNYLHTKNKFTINTPTVVVCVRGTEFIVSENTAVKKLSEVAVFAGTVSVRNIHHGKEVIVPSKKQTSVAKGGTQSAPYAFTEAIDQYYKTRVVAFEKRVEATRAQLDEFINQRNKMIDDFNKKREGQIEKQWQKREEQIQKHWLR